MWHESGECDAPQQPCDEVYGCDVSFYVTYSNPAFANYPIVVLWAGGGKLASTLNGDGYWGAAIADEEMACGDDVRIVIGDLQGGTTEDYAQLLCFSCESGI